MSRNREIEEVLMLRQWGRWARPRIDQMLGNKPQPWVHEILRSQAEKMDAEKLATGDPAISDDMAAAIDILVSRLKAHEPEMHRLIMLYYVGGHNLAATGEIMRLGPGSYDRARGLWSSALNQLLGMWRASVFEQDRHEFF